MSGPITDRNRVPVFDGKAESYDKWRYICALGNILVTSMPISSVTVINVTDAQGKLRANWKAMEHLALWFESMKLLRLLTKSKTTEAWRVSKLYRKRIGLMTSLQLLNWERGSIAQLWSQINKHLIWRSGSYSDEYSGTQEKSTRNDLIVLCNRNWIILKMLYTNCGAKVVGSQAEELYLKMFLQIFKTVLCVPEART